MKTRFSTIDISVMIKELKRFLGMRVANVYDIDNKTYLIRIQKPDQKAVILLESGIRIHSTEFDWPKNPAPSGFSMKMRKHLKGRRFESITQLGIDRIVDLQFGSSEAAYHIILELYDRGNIVLTDYEYNILNILRPRTDTSQEVCYAVRERYPLEAAKQHEVPTKEKLQQIILSGKEGDPLKKMLIPNLDYGPALLDHCLKGVGFSENIKLGKGFNIAEDITKLMLAIEEAEQLLEKLKSEHTKGFVIQKKDQRPVRKEQDSQDIIIYEEFHPLLMRQHENKLFSEFETFDRAVDEFFSKVESQKLDMKTLQQEKAALKKLENVKKDHEKRICDLQKEQEIDVLRGQLIEMNLSLVDQALLRVRSAVANQIDWTEIWKLIKEAQLINDPVACAIRSVCLDTNQITLLLSDPYEDADDEDSEYEPIKPLRVTLDLSLGAYANSRKYFEKKKLAAKKEQKTVDASTKAIKSAQKKAKQTLKEVAIIASINKTRKTFWFEKFLWFISSENYLVIGGRDQQQNELIVKRYLKPGDLYVHADLHGASSCIIKNPSGEPVPPKTLNEAGTMAICNSAAWDAKVVTSAWYVYHDQVSKTAPSGEYLTTGSFMVRGKKNYLPPSYLIYGFAYIFKLEDGSIFRHKGERKVRSVEDEEKDTVKEIVVSVEQKDECEEKKESENCDVKTESDTCSSSECFVHKSSVDLNSDSLNEITADITEQEDKVETDDSETSESEKHSDEDTKDVFPDTYINLMHVAGDKFELKRDVRTSNTDDDLNDEGNRIIFLGDNQPVTIGKKCVNKGTKLSARQSRKGKREQSFNDDEDNVSWLKQEQTEKKEEEKQKLACTKPENAVQQPKRGQRGRRKKIKEKYRDQDDEERQLRMEILASAGAEKEVVSQKGKKGKNSKNVQINKQQEKKATKDFQKPGESTNRQTECQDKIEKSTDVSLEGSATQVDEEDEEKKVSSSKNTKKPANNEALDSDEEKVDDNLPSTNDTDILDSLTGCPLPEDEILYAIPMCAPYSCLINYKYKVKLLPGNTKRGKAAKTAINMFLQEKSGSSREKDLLRIMKDVDVSRNIPGKVKLAAPNLHKTKK